MICPCPIPRWILARIFHYCQQAGCAGSLHRVHIFPIPAIPASLTPFGQELHGRQVSEALMGPHAVVGVVPLVNQLVEIPDRISFLEGPELIFGGLCLTRSMKAFPLG